MAEIVLEMIPVMLEGIVVLVFGLPARPAGSHDGRHGLFAETMIGDKGVVVQQRLGVVARDDDFTPVHRDGIRTVAQEHIVDKALGPALPIATVPVFRHDFTDEVELGQLGDLLVDERM